MGIIAGDYCGVYWYEERGDKFDVGSLIPDTGIAGPVSGLMVVFCSDADRQIVWWGTALRPSRNIVGKLLGSPW